MSIVRLSSALALALLASGCDRSTPDRQPDRTERQRSETNAASAAPPSATARASPPCKRGSQRDLAYRRGEEAQPVHRLDLHVPESGADLPVVVYLHGGAWREGDKSDVFEKPSFFMQEGFIFASIGYRLSTPGSGVAHPMHVEDAAAAVAWLERNLRDFCGDPARMVAMGHSAGGQIVALLGADVRYLRRESASPRALRCAMINDTEGFDLPRLFAARKDGWLREVYENAFGSSDNVLRDASPIRHIAAHPSPPQFLLVTRGSEERREQVDAFAAATRKAGGIAFVIDAGERDHLVIDREIGLEGDPIGATTVRFYRRCLGMDRPSGPR